MKKSFFLLVLLALIGVIASPQFNLRTPETILPLDLMRKIIFESSGELPASRTMIEIVSDGVR